MCEPLLLTLPLLIGWMLDILLGDPPYLPHPIVGFGKMISFGEHRLNKGNHRKIKGGIMAVVYILLVFDNISTRCGALINKAGNNLRNREKYII